MRIRYFQMFKSWEPLRNFTRLEGDGAGAGAGGDGEKNFFQISVYSSRAFNPFIRILSTIPPYVTASHISHHIKRSFRFYHSIAVAPSTPAACHGAVEERDRPGANEVRGEGEERCEGEAMSLLDV